MDRDVIAFGELTATAFHVAGQETTDGPIVRPVQFLKTGRWKSNRYGEIVITEADIDHMIANFSSGRYPEQPFELCIDYNHLASEPKQPGDGEAAGWVKTLYKKVVNGAVELWGNVEWVKDAAERIRTKKFRGFSPLFQKNFKNNKGELLGPTLLGGGITNTPFLQDLATLSLSADPWSHLALPIEGASPMPRTIRIGNVDVDEDALRSSSEARVMFTATPPQNTPPTPPPGDFAAAVAQAVATALAPVNTAMTALSTTVANVGTALDNERKERRQSQAEASVAQLIKDGKLAPKDKDQWVALAADNHEMFVKLSATLQPVIKLKADGPGKIRSVKAGDSGQSASGAADTEEAEEIPTGQDAVVAFEAEVAKVKKDEKVSTDAAIGLVQSRNPDLALAYRDAGIRGEGVTH